MAEDNLANLPPLAKKARLSETPQPESKEARRVSLALRDKVMIIPRDSETEPSAETIRALGRPLRYEVPPASLAEAHAKDISPGDLVEPHAMLLCEGDVINRSEDTEADWGEASVSNVTHQPQASTVAHREDRPVSPGENNSEQPRTIQAVAKLIALAAISPPRKKAPRIISGWDLLAATDASFAVAHLVPPAPSIYEDIKGAEAKTEDAFESFMNRRRRFMGYYASQCGCQLDPALRSRGAPAPQGA